MVSDHQSRWAALAITIATTFLMAASLAVLSSCAVSHKTVVPPAQVLIAKDATEPELLAQYNHFAHSIQTVNTAVEMTPVAGSAYTGVVEQYHEVEGFILAMRPVSIRVIGQAPVLSKNIFDMASDGATFEVFIPSKNKFLTGPANLQRSAAKPIENLRPQHLVDALLPSEIAADTPVIFEESDQATSRSYVLTALVPASKSSGDNAQLDIARKIWFDRANLSLSRVEVYGPGGRLDSDVHFTGWHEVPDAGGVVYPSDIHIDRPHDGYQLGIHIKHLTLNAPITADHFTLTQPPGTELVRVGENAGSGATTAQ